MSNLTPEEKERLAFRAEMLTLLCSVGDLLDDIHEMMHATPEEKEKRIEKVSDNPFGDRISENTEFFIKYLREVRTLPDDETLFFKGLAALKNKQGTL